MVIPPETVARMLLKLMDWLSPSRLSPAPVGALMEKDSRRPLISGRVPVWALMTISRGDTPGGCAFLFPDGEAGTLFCGDTLCAGSIGRTDLPGGDYETLMESIRTQLLPLPPGTRAYPGHGCSTTIGMEKTGNPYLK